MKQTVNKSSATSNMLQNGLDMIYLATCALWDVVPQKKMMDRMNLSDVYRVSKHQTMAAATYYGLEKWLRSPEGSLPESESPSLNKWQQTRDMAIRKNAMLDLARESLLAYFEEHCIWYMPLKGAILKDMYPRLGMRQMADNDILIDAAYRKQIYDHMIAQGYEGKYYEYEAHDIFLKKPFYNFEMHNTLFASNVSPAWQEYYQDVIKKLIKSKEDGFEYHFSDEDFYIYMMAHAYKHHSHSGNGVRHLMDVQVYLMQKPAMDWRYIQKELECLGIAEYESIVRTLSAKLFDSKCKHPKEIRADLTNEESDLLEISIGVGTYGTHENNTKNALRRYSDSEKITIGNRLKYCMDRLFCKDGIYWHYPKLAKYKILHPVLYFCRLMKIFGSRRKRILTEIKTIVKLKNL